jgi:hypothetical protein
MFQKVLSHLGIFSQTKLLEVKDFGVSHLAKKWQTATGRRCSVKHELGTIPPEKKQIIQTTKK